MSDPISADALLTLLKQWGIKYNEVDGWRTRGRDSATGLAFGPVHGAVVHHTGDDAPDYLDQRVIVNGRSDLPGPLAQFGGRDDGSLDLISIHRCNHAGGGDPAVLKAVMAENYDKYPPATQFHEGEAGAVDGNDAFYGIENYYSGGHEMSPACYTLNVRLWAALCTFHGWSAKSVIGHKEWSDYKVDPGKIDMAAMRQDISDAIKAGPGGNTALKPKLRPRYADSMHKNIRYAKSIEALADPDIDSKAILASLKKQRLDIRRESRKG